LFVQDTSSFPEINEEELQYLKEAVDILRRRNADERAPELARTETREWQQIQEGLEKEAMKAKERREQQERMAEEARQKAQNLESAVGEEIKEEFSFLPNSFQFGEAQKAYGNENPFSFFGIGMNNPDEQRARSFPKSYTQPVMVEKKETWLKYLFNFWGTTQRDEEPGQGTITLEPAKRTSVFDFFVSPDLFAPRQPGRGSITIEEPKKPSIFSFLAKFSPPRDEMIIDPERRKKLQEYEDRRRSRQEKLSWLEAGRSRILEQGDRKLSRKEARRLQRELEALAAGNSTTIQYSRNIPQLAKWTKTPDGRITGYITESTGKFKMGTKITTSRIKGQVIKAGVIVTTGSGSQYRLGLPLSLAPVSTSSSESFRGSAKQSFPFGNPFQGFFAGDENIPSLVEWIQNEDGTITGFVNNKEGFEDGTQITTSPVKLDAKTGMIVQTRGGSKYKLLKRRK
jgi:hypothetical protein